MRGLKKQIIDFLFAIKISWKNTRIHMLNFIIFSCVSSAMEFLFDVFFLAYVMKLLITNTSWESIFTTCILGAVVVLIRISSNELALKHQITYVTINMEAVNKDIYEKSLEYDLSDYFNPQFYDEYSFVLENGARYINHAVNTLSSIGVAIVFLGFFIAEAFNQNIKIIALVIILVMIKVILEQFLNKKVLDIDYNNERKLQPYIRRKDYFKRLFFMKANSYELKSNNLHDFICDEFEQSVEMYGKQLYKNKQSELFKWHFLNSINFNFFTDIIVPIILILFLRHEGISDVSEYWKVSALFIKLSGMYIFRIPSDLRQISKYISNMRGFLQKEVKHGSTGELAEDHSISIENVSFSYDENSDFALKNININIPSKQKVAIVGRNGSGKTTLLNLLLGLYSPTSGRIVIAGKDIKEFDKQQYKHLIGLLCQNFNLYHATVKENINMGKDSYSDAEIGRSLSLAQCADLIDKFPKGVDTKIGKDLDESAVELSGGQAQRIAMARIFLTKAPFVFLDEPTASIDPVFEAPIIDNLMEKVRDKTVVVITHRLDITKFVDNIYVMEDGEIVESGTFEKLMKSDSVFRDMYRHQKDD